MRKHFGFCRFFSLVLAVSMAVSCLTAGLFPVSAVAEGEWIAEDQSIIQGTQTVEVPIRIGANPGIVSAQVEIGYDAEYFTLTEVRDGQALGTATHTDKLTNNPYKLSWENDTAQTDFAVTDAVVATLVFSVDAQTPVDTYTVSVHPVSDNTINAALEYVPFTGANGTITVACAQHNWALDHYTAPEPDCTTGSKGVFVCSVCGAEEEQDIDPLGHDYQAGTVVPATCAEQGYTIYVCSHDASHTEKRDYTAIDSDNHDFQAGTIVPGTCTEQGYTIYVCSHNASHTEKRDYTPIDPDNHDYQTVVTPPTYYSQGYTTYICKHDPSHTYVGDYTDPVVDESSPTVFAETVRGSKGTDVQVKISIRNNPGITGAKILIGYDAGVLTLTNVEDGGILGENVFSDILTANPYALAWENDTTLINFTEDGVIAILTFHIDDNAENGDVTITVTPDWENTLSAGLSEVPLLGENGTVTIAPPYKVGDVDGNGKVEPKDRVLLARYLAKWGGEYNNIDLQAADIDKNGKVEPKDRVLLARYLAKWGGEYDTYFE